MKFNNRVLINLLCFFLLSLSANAEYNKDLIGKWDLEVTKDGKVSPSWLEVVLSGNSTLVGRFVYLEGSARPITEVKNTGNQFSFEIPTQWEKGEFSMKFSGQINNDQLKGTMRFADGKTYHWKGTRAPKLKTPTNLIWGAPRSLFNGKDLKGWHADGKNQWYAKDGILKSDKSGANLITDDVFQNFKIHVEFRYPENGNSGVYLRGRYEVQFADNQGLEPSSILFGGVYGFLTPNEIVAKAPGEWQYFDITLLGRRVTVVANGKTVICDQIIPGITGGAIDSREGMPGPIMLQGDHEPVEFRNIVITPLVE